MFRKEIKKILFFVGALLAISSVFFLFQKKNSQLLNPFFENKKPTTLIFVGDIMLSRSIEKIVYREEDPLYHFLIAKDVTSSADISFANLEGPVSLRGNDQGGIYSFRMHPDLLKGLTYGGFDIVSVANNHAFDWGPQAYADTLMYLKKEGIKFTGGGDTYNEAHTATRIEKNGVVFCFLGYTEFASDFVSSKDASPEMNKLHIGTVKDDIATAKAQGCGSVIISIHWGIEYDLHPQPDQVTVAHAIIDAGALMVIGHHPHVIQDVEEYHKGLIAYSLGNFVFDQNFSKDTREGLLLQVTTDGKSINSLEKVKVHFTDTYQPVPEKNL